MVFIPTNISLKVDFEWGYIFKYPIALVSLFVFVIVFW
jgi:hypothetical protein